MLILMLTLVCVSATPGSLRGKALVSFLDLNSPPEVSAAASEGAVSEGEAPCSLDKQGTDKEEPEPEEDEEDQEEEEGDGEGAESEGDGEMDETPCAEEKAAAAAENAANENDAANEAGLQPFRNAVYRLFGP